MADEPLSFSDVQFLNGEAPEETESPKIEEKSVLVAVEENGDAKDDTKSVEIHEMKTVVNDGSTKEPETEKPDDKKPEEIIKKEDEEVKREDSEMAEVPASNDRKRKASESSQDSDFAGFEPPAELQDIKIKNLSKLINKISKETKESDVGWSKFSAILKRNALDSPAHSTDEPSRPSSGLSFRSESELMAVNYSSTELGSSAANSPVPVGTPAGNRGGRASLGGRTSSLDLSSPQYRAPMERGWKRELVYRASLDKQGRRQGDIYYYSPKGKKLRSTREVSEHLSDNDLTIENFTFFKGPLGLDDPDKEIIRNAKIVASSTMVSAAPAPAVPAAPPAVLGKRTPKPKGPKGASPERGVSATPKIRPIKNIKLKARVSPAKSSSPSPLSEEAPPVLTSAPPAEGAAKPTRKSLGLVGKKKRVGEQRPQVVMYTPMGQRQPDSEVNKYFDQAVKTFGTDTTTKMTRELCSVHCPNAKGEVPTMQCSLCRCLYHETCAGMRQADLVRYICKNCQTSSPVKLMPPQLTQAPTIKPQIRGPPRPPPQLTPQPRQAFKLLPQPRLIPVVRRAPPPNKLTTIRKLNSEDIININKANSDPNKPNFNMKSVIGSVTTWLPPSSTIRMGGPKSAKNPANMQILNNMMNPPQTIAILNGRRYIIVPKHSVMNVTSSNAGGAAALKQTENAPKIDSAGDGGEKSEEAKSNDEVKVKDESVDGDMDVDEGESIEAEEKDLGETEQMEDDTKKRKLSEIEESPSATPKKKLKSSDTPKTTMTAENGNDVDGNKNKRKSRGRVEVTKSGTPSLTKGSKSNQDAAFNAVVQTGLFVKIFQYLKMRELASAAKVCRAWRNTAATPVLWRNVRMKNSQVNDWKGLSSMLKKRGTRHLDMRKMLLPSVVPQTTWKAFTTGIATVHSLQRIDLCRCPCEVLEGVCRALPQLRVLMACSVRAGSLDPGPFANLTSLTELRIKVTNDSERLTLTSSLKCLEKLTNLVHLSITSITSLGEEDCEAISHLQSLEWLELGDCSGGGAGAGAARMLLGLPLLRRLRLERLPSGDDTTHLIKAVANCPNITSLELINVEVKPGVEVALGSCGSLERLLIIPMYVSQSATTNHCVLDGVMRLRSSLKHLVWGITVELMRVTELFILQCDEDAAATRRNRIASGQEPLSPPARITTPEEKKECIPVLKPVPGFPVPLTTSPQVEILPVDSLQKLLLEEMPNTQLRILRIPYHSTWRQALADTQ